MPIVSLSGSAVVENNSIAFSVTLSEPPIDAVTMNYRTLLNGTAVDSDTFYGSTSNQNNGTLTFAPGETSATLTVFARSDSSDERDESITLELYNLTEGSEFASGQPTQTAFGIIRDDDGAGSNLAVFVSDPTIVEDDSGTTNALFEVRLSQPAPSAMTFSYQTVEGSATDGQDYTGQSGALNFASGQEVAFISVPVIGDRVGETSETFSLVVTPPGSPTVGTDGAAGVATILDDDSGVGPEVSISGGSVVENNSIRFTISLSEPPIDAVSMSYRTLLNGTAVDGDTFYGSTSNQNNGTVTFSPGQMSTDIFVFARSDSSDERDEAITVELFNLTENATFAGGELTLATFGIIQDDDGVGSNLAVFVSDPEIVESDSGTKEALFEVRLSQPASATISLAYATADGSALAGQDYTAQSGTITFAPGQDLAYVSVAVSGDTTREFTESFDLIVTPPGSPSIGTAGAVGTADILDDDSGDGPVISVESGYAVENNSIRYVVTLSEAPELDPITVEYQTRLGTAADSDTFYGSTSNQNNGTLTFAPGQSTASVYVFPRSDSLDERDENILLRLFDPVGAVLAGGGSELQVNGFILDDDGVGLNIALAGAPTRLAESAEGDYIAYVEVELSQPSSTALTFDVSASNGTATAADYALLDSTVSFAPGQTSGFVRVRIDNDSVDEGLHSFSLNYAAQPGSIFAGVIQSQTVTIEDARGVVRQGGATNDRLIGTAANDTLFGGDGADFLVGRAGADTMNGGRGNDFYVVDNPGDVIQGEIAFSSGGGIDTVRVFIDNYVQPENVELVRIGNITDTFNFDATGNDAPGTLVGNAGNNRLVGRGGNDQINGNDGNDRLVGNTGRDTLVGGNGNDTFIYTAYADSRAGSLNRDVINGFFRTPGQDDLIDLSLIDANTRTRGVDDAFDFIGSARFSGTAGELRYQGLGGPNAVIVEADHNGDRVADLQIFVNLTTWMTGSDFIL